MSVGTVSHIVAAFVSGALCVAALMHNFRSRAAIAFAIFAGLLFAHDGLTVLDGLDAAVRFRSVRLHAASLLLLAPSLLWLLPQILPEERKICQRFSLFIVPLVCVGLALLAVPAFSHLSFWIFQCGQFLILITVVAGIIGIARAIKKSKLTRERLRLRYALWAGVVTLAFYVTNALNYTGWNVPPLGTFARVIFLHFIFQSFIQRSLVTGEEIVARLSLFGVISFVLSGIYFLLVSWVGDRGLFFLNTFIASFVIIQLFDPIRNLTNRITRRMFLRRHFHIAEELEILGNKILGTMDLHSLAKSLEEAFKKCLGVERARLFALDAEGLTFFEILPEEDEKKPKGEITATDPLVEYMHLYRGRPFVLETIENDEKNFFDDRTEQFFRNCRKTMDELGADFLIPYHYGDQIVGFSATQTGETIALSTEQLRIFLPLARQVAGVLKNAENYAILRNREKLAAVGEMAAGLAHEIRNPLGAIKGAAQLLKSDAANEEYLEIIVDESNRLSNVLSEFLDYARPKYEPVPMNCNPFQVMEHTLSLVRSESDIPVKIEGDRLVRVQADPDLLKQVLLNLFHNALSAMKGIETPQLLVRVHRKGGEPPLVRRLPHTRDRSAIPPELRGIVEIEVEDCGEGIPQELISKIFVPFYTTKSDGTGLGLAISQRLLESMGGSIHVKRGRPQGTIVTISLPEGVHTTHPTPPLQPEIRAPQ